MCDARSTGEDSDDPAALYGSEEVAAVGHHAPWYSVDRYAYGVNDWRGNAVAENQLPRRPNDIPIYDVTPPPPRTGNGNAVVMATTTTTATTSTSRSVCNFSSS